MSNELIQTNTAKLTAAFATALVVAETQIHDDLAYNSIKEWDSTAHMLLIAELENVFNLMLDTDDIIDMSSVAKAKAILGKYGVAF
ncbi:acyl carrier protein [Rheinheimera mesophila]|uniref:Acyl carrier protein n=1 Tax=Rheinheimera mesophila TaxID=1547515 RepID=A0A3P3QRN1_9GAMM|nr:acyl carrier protein [Rheinheimera mesophila]KKL01078.1 acyl carrier protein [Rheinheimera mesophila]RRJ23189.1 acyl carrier protein [Rheinheimera mesophila]